MGGYNEKFRRLAKNCNTAQTDLEYSQQTETPVAESSAVTRPASLPQTLGEMLAPSAAFSAPGMMTQSKPRVAVPLEP